MVWCVDGMVSWRRDGELWVVGSGDVGTWRRGGEGRAGGGREEEWEKGGGYLVVLEEADTGEKGGALSWWREWIQDGLEVEKGEAREARDDGVAASGDERFKRVYA